MLQRHQGRSLKQLPLHHHTSSQSLIYECCGIPSQVFLVGDDFRTLYTKKRFEGLFDVVSLSVGSSHFLGDKDLTNLLAPTGASIHVENVK